MPSLAVMFVWWSGSALCKKRTSVGAVMQVGELVVERAIFQTVASMLLPAFTIHSIVRATTPLFARLGRGTRYGPSIAGLCAVPFLPVMFDKPVEHGLRWAFERLKSD